MIYTLAQKLYRPPSRSTMYFFSTPVPKGTLSSAATTFKGRYLNLAFPMVFKRNIPESLCINGQADYCTFTEESFVKVQLVTLLRLIYIAQSYKVN